MQHIFSINAELIAEKCKPFININLLKTQIVKKQHMHDVNTDIDEYSENNNAYQICHDSYDLKLTFDEYKKIIEIIKIDGLYVFSSYVHNLIMPIICYLYGGHVNVHHDPNNIKIYGLCSRTLLVCVGSNDVSGGTMFYFGNGLLFDKDPHLKTYTKINVKESVTPQKGVLFIGDMIHSGIPVSKNCYKVIVQIPIITGLNIVKNFYEIKCSNGKYIIRKSFVDEILPNRDWNNITVDEFYPIFLALYGKPTIATSLLKKTLNPKYYYTSGICSDILADRTIPEDNYSVYLDEAVYYCRQNAKIFNGNFEMIQEINGYDSFFQYFEKNINLFKISLPAALETIKKFNMAPKSPFKQIGIDESNIAKMEYDKRFNQTCFNEKNNLYIIAYVVWY